MNTNQEENKTDIPKADTPLRFRLHTQSRDTITIHTYPKQTHQYDSDTPRTDVYSIVIQTYSKQT